jgi:nucleotidyltransferase/DNA polymerase involved in DNA repair
VPAARELALKVKRALRDQVGECLTCSIGIAPNVFLGKVGSDLQKPDGLVVITADNLPDVLLGLELQEVYGIGERMEQRLHRAGIDLVPASRHQPDLFAADNQRRQKLSPLIDRINDRYGRCAIGFGLFPPDVRAFKGHAAFNRVPERWEF